MTTRTSVTLRVPGTGDVTVLALHDGEGPFFEPRAAAFPAATAGHWRRADALDPGAVRDGEWWLRFRCFALRFGDGRVVLVDAGIGPADAPAKAWAPVPGRLPAALAGAGIDPADVGTVVLTHVHTDHVGWAVGEDRAPFFPNARYLLQRAEVEAVERGNPELAAWLLHPLRAAGQLATVAGGSALAPGVRVLPTPGHTPGHQSVLLKAGDATVLLTGDLLVHAAQLLDPALGYAHEDDQDAAAATRTSLLRDLAARGGATLATPHLGEAFVPLGPA